MRLLHFVRVSFVRPGERSAAEPRTFPVLQAQSNRACSIGTMGAVSGRYGSGTADAEICACGIGTMGGGLRRHDSRSARSRVGRTQSGSPAAGSRLTSARLPHATGTKPQVAGRGPTPSLHSCDKGRRSRRTSAGKTAEVPQNPRWERNLSNQSRTCATGLPAACRTCAGRRPPAALTPGGDAEEVIGPRPIRRRLASGAPPAGTFGHT